jgi:hypothetical protein
MRRFRLLPPVCGATILFGWIACAKDDHEAEARATLASFLRDSLGPATDPQVAFIAGGGPRDSHLYVHFDTSAFANASDSAFAARARDVARFALRHYPNPQALDSVTIGARENMGPGIAKIHHTLTFPVAELDEGAHK